MVLGWCWGGVEVGVFSPNVTAVLFVCCECVSVSLLHASHMCTITEQIYGLGSGLFYVGMLHCCCSVCYAACDVFNTCA